jgi:hypothetical protein
MGEVAVIDAENDTVLENLTVAEAGQSAQGLALRPFWWFER